MDYLKQKSNQSQSAYDQISDLLQKLFQERPPQRRVYGEFENLTAQLQEIRLPEGLRLPSDTEKTAAQFQQLQFAPHKKVSLEADEEEKEDNNEEEQEEVVEGVDTEDMQQLSRVLQQLGVQFTQLDAFRLQKAVQDLITEQERKDDKIQLFGKIGPYWILRSETSTFPEPEEEQQQEEEPPAEEEPAEENAEKEEKDEELQQLEDQWNEIKAAQKEKDLEGTEKVEPEAENPPEPEKKPEEDDLEPDMGGIEEKKPEGEEENAEKIEEGEVKEELKSNVSLEDEFQPETKVPKRVNTYHGGKYPLKKIQKIPDEEHEGLNKYLFFAALDVQINDLNTELFQRLQNEYQKLVFRKKNNLKQAKTKFNKIINTVLSAPLHFIALPDLKPEQMRAFMTMSYQQIKFTGDLSSEVKIGLPAFTGTEATLVRCAISKIMHQYTIVPKGFYTKEEDTDEQEEKKRMEELQQKQRQEIQTRFELLRKTQNEKIYEIMIKNPHLFKYAEDENKLELTTAFAEAAEEFKGFENYLTLLSERQWVYLFPRINGQGRVIEVNDDDYEGIGEPEPCEFKVAEERVNRIKRERAEKKAKKQAERDEIAAKKKLELNNERKFKKWLEAFKEKNQQDDEQNVEEELEINVAEDEFDDTNPVDKPELSPDLPYEELQKYYTQKLWRKLRQFKRPVAPWDAPIIDNRVNVPQAELFIHKGQLDKTRVDFKQKCSYNVDEFLLENEIDLKKTKLPLWKFNVQKLQQLGNGQSVITASNTRCTGALNIVSGLKFNKHQFVYFGNGVDQAQIDAPVMMLPDMCCVPTDIREEPEVAPEMQRMEFEFKADRKRRIAEAKKKAEEEAAKGEGEVKEE
ncbi:Radial_spokehead-like protein [Hexamita inflata]|uniref:Radial spokehead-like protein n=1 Tax=Hexamita inflata TaxID=28002 RepID=A0AA86URQ5_9EUKA|nr:Radial spokehead-like protein [Hexamita inflata]